MSRIPRTKKETTSRALAPATNGNGVALKRSDVKDLSELFANRTAVITIYDPRDEFKTVKRDTGFRWEIAPVWSPEAEEIKEQYRDQIRRVDGKIDLTDPKVDESIREQIIRVTKRFWQEPESPTGIVLDGELLTPTPENARKILTHPDLWWLYQDVQAAYLERGSFFGARPKTA